jgi:hypothetical protein
MIFRHEMQSELRRPAPFQKAAASPEIDAGRSRIRRLHAKHVVGQAMGTAMPARDTARSLRMNR